MPQFFLGMWLGINAPQSWFIVSYWRIWYGYYLSLALNFMPFFYPGWRRQWQHVVLGLEEWSQFPAIPNNCPAWYALRMFSNLPLSSIIPTRLTSIITLFAFLFPWPPSYRFIGQWSWYLCLYLWSYWLEAYNLRGWQDDKNVERRRECHSRNPSP